MTQAPFPAQQKASLAIDHASEALSLCAIAKRGSGACPYIPEALAFGGKAFFAT